MFNKKQESAKPQFEKFDTLIGKATVIEGTLKTEEPLRVDGSVNGELISRADLIIGDSGRIKGNITCQNLLLAGKVEGNISASGQLHITATGTLLGDASIRSFIVDEQGTFDGKCQMVQDAPSQETSTAAGSSVQPESGSRPSGSNRRNR